MYQKNPFILIVLLVTFTLACGLFPRPTTPSPTAPPATNTLTPTALITLTSTPSGPCELVAENPVTVYMRPSTEAWIFGTLDTTMRLQISARTADNWFGFDPGVAQAANIGVFRLRWVPQSIDVRLEGGCGEVPIVEGPPPGVCFTMPMGDTDVYLSPDSSSSVFATLHLEDYAAVIGRTADGWGQLDLSLGNTPLEGIGWVEGATLNLNGPCEDLPVVTP